MAFVVPAEIGHAPYAVPLLEYLIGHFDFVQIVPVQEKLFPDLSEDCWLLYAEGYAGAADFFKLTPITRFHPMRSPPTDGPRAGLAEWNKWNCRLRPFVLPSDIRAMYRAYVEDLKLPRLGSLAKVSIGYVTGDNDFFHLRPSEAQELQIPSRFLCPSVRNGRVLNGTAITQHDVETWLENDEPVLLLRLQRDGRLTDAVQSYLETPAAQRARTGYKCRNRDPWYVVPDVTAPDGFLSYMSGMGASLVANDAKCVCTNSVHAVKMRDEVPIEYVQQRWKDPITVLSREIEGHPLGGGMLKLEPGEATNVILGSGRRIESRESKAIKDGIQLLRKWRHHG